MIDHRYPSLPGRPVRHSDRCVQSVPLFPSATASHIDGDQGIESTGYKVQDRYKRTALKEVIRLGSEMAPAAERHKSQKQRLFASI